MQATKQHFGRLDILVCNAAVSAPKQSVEDASIADFEAMNSVWDAWVDTANPPARATGESRLASPDYKVEIIVIAAKA